MPSSRRTTTSPSPSSRDTCTALAPTRTVAPSASSAVRTTWPAAGSSGGSKPSIASTTVTAAPYRANIWASSTPIAPPPSTTSDCGVRSAEIASRLVQYRVSRRPSIGGTTGADPVPTTTARDAT